MGIVWYCHNNREGVLLLFQSGGFAVTIVVASIGLTKGVLLLKQKGIYIQQRGTGPTLLWNSFLVII